MGELERAVVAAHHRPHTVRLQQGMDILPPCAFFGVPPQEMMQEHEHAGGRGRILHNIPQPLQLTLGDRLTPDESVVSRIAILRNPRRVEQHEANTGGIVDLIGVAIP